MKILFLAFICSVIPAFFVFVFLHGTKNRLAALRERCRVEPDGARAAVEYESARTAFPGRLIARWFGFGPMAAPPNSPTQKSSSNPPRAS